MAAQVESGHLCPITMTRAAVAALAAEPALLAQADAEDRLAQLRPGVSAVVGKDRHDARHGHDREAGRHRRARQHHRAPTPAGDGYAITGHKWFMSAPMCDAFLVLAQAPGGLTCFFVPRFRPDGTRQRAPLPAAQGQARQPLQRLVARSSSPAPSPGASATKARGVAHHHRDGAADAARLRARLRRADAHGAGAGAASRRHRTVFQQAARRSADDARGAGRSWRSRSRRRPRCRCGSARAFDLAADATRARRPMRGC